MEKNWKKIKEYNKSFQAELSKHLLEENNIPAVILNKQDSSYLFGKIELYVSDEDEESARAILNKQEDLTDED